MPQISNIRNLNVSETFLEFSAPLLEFLGPGARDNDIDWELINAYCVWNALVIDAVQGDDQRVAEIRRTVAHDPSLARYIENLIIRKRDLFFEDHRLIDVTDFTRAKGILAARI